MKPLLNVLVSGASLALLAAAVPEIRGQLLNAAIPTAWAQQDRGRGGDKGKDNNEGREDDRDRGGKNGDKTKERSDRDNDRDSGSDRGGGKSADRADPSDRGGGTDKDRSDTDRGSKGGADNDRGGGNDRDQSDKDRGAANEKGSSDSDRGGANDRDQSDKDRGGANEKGSSDSDRGGGNDKDRSDKDRSGGKGGADNDRGGGRSDHEERGAGNNGGNGAGHEDNRGGNKDTDRASNDNRGGGNDPDRGGSDNRGNKDPERTARDNEGTRGANNEGRGSNNEGRGGGRNDGLGNNGIPGGGRGNDASDNGSPSGGGGNEGSNNGNPGGGGNDASKADVADRFTDPAERSASDESDSDVRAFASRFDLDDNETFDDDGFLARRGEIIAMSKDTLLRRRAAALGLQVVEQVFLGSLNTTMYRLSVPRAAPIDGILARLRAQDPDGVFDRNHLYERSAASVAPTSSLGTQSTTLVESAKGISVGLIDTGVDALHPALAGTHTELRYFVDESRKLPEEHGTAVVSLLVSPQFGVLPDAQLYVACVFYEDRRGTSLSEAQDLVRALDWLMQRRVPVINMSLSGPPNEVLRVAVTRAISAGHLIVAAVGNAGPAAPPLYPAAYDGVIAVTAVDGGQHVYRRANRGAYVQLAAMGVDVVAAGPAGPASYSGTSFASPYVAALAAVEYRALDPQKALVVKQTLQDNALDLGKPGRDEIYGFGLARPRAIATVAR